MPRTTRITIGKHFSRFIESKIEEGRFETVRAGLRLLEQHENKLEELPATLREVEDQLQQREIVDGEKFMISK